MICHKNPFQAGKIAQWGMCIIIAVGCSLIGTVLAFSPTASAHAQDLTWQWIGPSEDVEILDLNVDPKRPQRLFVATRNGVYRSINGGAIWEKVLSGFFRKVVIDPQNTNIVYTGPHGPSGYGVYKSVNGGDDWTFHNEGMTCSNLATMAIATSNPEVLFIGSF